MERADFIKKSIFLSLGSVVIPFSVSGEHIKNGDGLPVFIAPGTGDEYLLPNMKITVKLSAKESVGAYEIFEEITEANFGPPLHAHKEQWEILEILEGKYKIQMNDDVFIAMPGSIAIVPPETPHCFLNINEAPSKLRFILSPGLNFEGFVKYMSKMKGLPSPDSLAEVLREFGMELLGEHLKQ